MHNASLLTSLALCAVAPLALAQRIDASADAASTVATETQGDAVSASPRTPPKSAFGRVMGLMTQLLQEASTRPANTDAPSLITSFENAGVSVRVTPVDGGDDGAARYRLARQREQP